MLYTKISRSLLGNDIGSGMWFKSVCFNFFSTNSGSSVIGTHTSNGFDDIIHNDIPYFILKKLIKISQKAKFVMK